MDMDKKYLIIKGKGPILITGTHVVRTLRKKYELHNSEEYVYDIIPRLYEKLGGMTGTASTEAEEFMDIYGLPVLEIPTNEAVNRIDENDEI